MPRERDTEYREPHPDGYDPPFWMLLIGIVIASLGFYATVKIIGLINGSL